MLLQNLGQISLVIRNIKWILILSIIFTIGIYYTRWYARKKHKKLDKIWNKSFKSAILVNITWLIINILIRILFHYLFTDFMFLELIITSINILIGTIVVMMIYKKEFWESILFVVIIQVSLLVLTLVLNFLIDLILIPPYIFLYIIVEGLPQTLVLTALGLLIGFSIGISLAIIRVYGGVELRWLGIIYEKIFRGIPLLVLIFLFYFGIPNISALNSVVLALGLRSGAYQSQIFRGAFLSVNPGQMEAGSSLGMNRLKTFRHILLPQALRIALPSWSNEYAVVIKDSSFAFEVGIIELTRAAYYVSVSNRELWAVTYAIVALTYFLFTFPFTKFFGERQTNKLKKLGMGGG